MKNPSGHCLTLSVAVMLLLLFGCSSAKEPRTHPPALPKAGPETEMGKVRAAYGDREDFFSLCEKDRPLEEWVHTLNAELWQEALVSSERWLRKCPVDIDARFVAAAALTELGRPDDAAEHVRWYRGMIDSIFATGDGKSPATALVVISIAEEYSILHALGLERKEQSLLDGGIDALRVVDRDGRDSTIYFNPAAHFRRLQRMFP
jgi:hypothetical protein